MQFLFSDYGAGAATATDLVNTAPRVRAAGEALPDTAALGRFLTEHGIEAAAPTEADPTEADLSAVHGLRTELRTLLDTATTRGPDGLARGANALLARAAALPELRRSPEDGWQWYLRTPPGAPLADQLAALTAVGVLGTLRTLGPARFRPCASPDCDGAFVDTSRAGRRRYCTPDLCGNRLNVANHRARRA